MREINNSDRLVSVGMAAQMCRITFEHAWANVTSGLWTHSKVLNRIFKVPMSNVDEWNSYRPRTRKRVHGLDV